MDPHIDVAQFFRERIERRLQEQCEMMRKEEVDESVKPNVHNFDRHQYGAHNAPQTDINTKPKCEDFINQALAVSLLDGNHQLNSVSGATRKNFTLTMHTIYKANLPAYVSLNLNATQRAQAFNKVAAKPAQSEESGQLLSTFRNRPDSCLEAADDLDNLVPLEEGTDNSGGPKGSDERKRACSTQIPASISSPSIDEDDKNSEIPEQTIGYRKTVHTENTRYELHGDKVLSSPSVMNPPSNPPNKGRRNTAAPNPKGKKCLYLEPAPGTPVVHITRPRSMRQNRGSCKTLPNTDRKYSSHGASIRNRSPSRLLSYSNGDSTGRLGTGRVCTPRYCNNPELSSVENPKPRSSRSSAIYRILSQGLFPDDESSQFTADITCLQTPLVPSPVPVATDVKPGKQERLFCRAKKRLSLFYHRLILCCTSATTD